MANMARKAEVGNGLHRKIDVDSLDENLYTDVASGNDGDLEASVTQRAREVAALITKGSVPDALKKALENPPVDSKDQSSLLKGRGAAAQGPKTVKDKNLATVLSVLTAVKSAEIANLVGSLDENEVHTLFQYVYAGMMDESSPHNVLLAWHEKVLDVVGQGGIIRVLTDRKTVL